MLKIAGYFVVCRDFGRLHGAAEKRSKYIWERSEIGKKKGAMFMSPEVSTVETQTIGRGYAL